LGVLLLADYKWESGGKLLVFEFSRLYPIAGFALYWDPKLNRWRFDSNVGVIGVACNNLVFFSDRRVVSPECYTKDLIKIIPEYILSLGGVEGFIGNPNWIDGNLGDIWSGDSHPFCSLYLNNADNRVVLLDKSGFELDEDKCVDLTCFSVFIESTSSGFWIFQDWLSEKTVMVWGFKSDFDISGWNDNVQVDRLIAEAKNLLYAYQFRVGIPSDEINSVGSNYNEVIIGSKDFFRLLDRGWPRPWWVAAWASKEIRENKDWVTYWSDTSFAMYKWDSGVIPKVLRLLGSPFTDIISVRDEISNWNVSGNSFRDFVSSLISEFNDHVVIKDSASLGYSPVDVIRRGEAGVFDATNCICELLRVSSDVWPVPWVGGGVPCKACVLDGDRGAFKAYDPFSDNWVLTEVTNDIKLGSYNDFNYKVEFTIIPIDKY